MNEQDIKMLSYTAYILANKPYGEITDQEKFQIQFALDTSWWGKQKLAGDFRMSESDKKLPEPTAEDCDRVYQYLTAEL